jgi:hypothetical protein
MATIPVVENPRRKRRSRRGLSAAQKRAGFGGRAAMRRSKGRKSTKRRRTRRRNPGRSMVTYTSNPRRRTTRRRSYSAPARRYRRRRNPGLMSGIDFKSVLFIGGGTIWTEVGPSLVGKFWKGMPRTGFTGLAVKAGVTIAGGVAVKMITKSTARQNQFIIGGLVGILVDLYRMYAVPLLQSQGLEGLNGLGGYISKREVMRIPGVAGYRRTPAGVPSRRVTMPTGPSMMEMAA